MNTPQPTANQALLSAVAKGNLSKATASLRQGANPNVADDLGQLPVLIAMRQKDRAMLALLMKHNADLRAVTQDNLYPMALAAIMGDSEAIRVMAAHCADFESPVENEPSALEHAFIAGRVSTAQELIRHGADVECLRGNGEPLISRMAAMGNDEALKLLIDEGVSVLMSDLRGQTPLRYAQEGGKRSTIRLIQAQINMQSTQAKVEALEDETSQAKGQGIRSRIKMLTLSAKLRMNPQARAISQATVHFLKSIEAGDLTEASNLLQSKTINVDMLSSTGVPLVILAARACKPQSIRSEAIDTSRLSMVQSLIERLVEKKANPLAIDKATGRNLLHELIEQGQETLAIHCLAFGFLSKGINRSDKNLDRPLHLASKSNMSNLAMALIQKGADLNPVNRLGQTPLHICALHLDISIAEILVGKGANRNLKTRKGQTVESLVKTIDDDARSFAMMLEARKSIESAMNIFTADNPMANMARSGLTMKKPPAKPL